jgi:hypothetical protein
MSIPRRGSSLSIVRALFPTGSFLAATASASLIAGGCGSGERDGSTIDESRLDDDSGGTGGEGGNSGSIIFGQGGGMSGGLVTESPDCVQDVKTARFVPVDLYVMFDQSLSMNTPAGAGSRLDAVRAAIADFLRDPKSEGLGLGIGYFGQMPRGETSCDPALYATPDVGVAPLPANASAIMTSLNGIEPVGETPTGAAIRGACTYATTYRDENLDHTIAILLVTDGIPEAPSTVEDGGSCNPTLEDAMDAAASCAAGENGIKTYVLGVGSFLSNLDQIAASGGTAEAHLVEGGNVTEEVLVALAAIRGDVIPCELTIPEPPFGQELDYSTVNVRYVTNGVEEVLYSVSSAVDCGTEDGWHYDASREHILLCAETCNRVSTDPTGTLDFALGCEKTRVR